MKKYELPAFLNGVENINQANYDKWLARKAATHLKRDRLRGNETAKGEEYKLAIHKAVVESFGLDAYTGEKLDWALLGQYNNEQSESEGRAYKHRLGLLPSVDHVRDGIGKADFLICAWRTNDAKNDLPYQEFVDLCRRVIEHHDKV
jgi:hypothetical protein